MRISTQLQAGPSSTTSRLRQPAAAAVAALVAVAALIATAVQAAAAVPGLVQVTAASPTSTLDKAVTVTCPAGTRVLNAGGFTEGAAGSVTMDALIPNAALTSVTVAAAETDFTPATWSVTAVATCAPAPAGLLRVLATSPANSVDKSVIAICPPGTTLLGAGASIQNGNGNVLLDELSPDGGLGVAATQVTAETHEDAAYASVWTVRAYAICAFPLTGQQRITADSAYDAKSAKRVTAACPSGQVATGGTAEVAALGALPGEIAITGAFVHGSTAVPPTSVTARATEEDPLPAGSLWAVGAHVFCADEL